MKKLFEIGSWLFLVLLIVIVTLTFIRIRDIDQITDDAYNVVEEKISSVNREDGVSDVEGYGLIITGAISGIGVGGLIIIYAILIIESFTNFIATIISFIFYRLFLGQYNSSDSKTRRYILGTIFFIISVISLGFITYISYCFNLIFKALDTLIAIEGIVSLALLIYIIVITLKGKFIKKDINKVIENMSAIGDSDTNIEITTDSSDNEKSIQNSDE